MAKVLRTDDFPGYAETVDNVTVLATKSGYAGQRVWVGGTLQKEFVCVPDSTATVDTTTTIACASGGRWLADVRPGVSSAALTPATLADADATKTVSQGSEFVLKAATLTVNRSITLSTAGAVTGEQVVVTREDVTAFTLAVINGGGGAGTKYTFPISAARRAAFTYDGTNWALSWHAAITP